MSNVTPFPGPRQARAVLTSAMESIKGSVLVLGYRSDGTFFADTNVTDDSIFKLLSDAHATISAALSEKHQGERGA
jgi:hypothetical protein